MVGPVGPEPLKSLHKFIGDVFWNAEGNLTPLQVHDICCNIADIVQVGGVRRAAMICYFSPDDEEMLTCKKYPENFNLMPGEEKNPWRARANNSVALLEEPSCTEFMKMWQTLAASGNGEPGLLHVYNIPKYIDPERRKFTDEFRTNPCGEILLRPYQFCNLTSVVIRPSDQFKDVIKKVKVAVWLGAFQSTLTKFKYIRREWSKNCNKERLLGVSLNGQLDNPEDHDPRKARDIKGLRH